MRVNEIFGSIDGEGLRTGELATFIRLAGCNLRCRYCDTDYALKNIDGEEMEISDIIKKVDEIGYKNITLTGGEPLIHKDVNLLIDELIKKGYKVNIETNGSVNINEYIERPEILITLDYKTISSGANDKMLLSNLEKLRETDVLKFVCNKDDLEDVTNVLDSHNIKSYIYLSPIFNEIEPSELVDYLKTLKNRSYINKTRVQVQLHKIIWNPSERGV